MNAVLYKSYATRTQLGLRKDPRSFWSFINSKRKCSSIPSNVFLDDSESSSVQESCELFAKHFASVFSCHITSQSEANEAASNIPVYAVEMDIFEISSDMIVAASKKLKNSYSPGPDGVPAIIFRRCAGSLASPLSHIFNKSFEQKKFPAVWKQSLMFPVHKKGDKLNVRNYRGSTSLSAGSKLIEIIVSNAILNATKSYISPNQHGFMPGRSVTTNLIEFTSTCISQIEGNAQVDAVYRFDSYYGHLRTQ